jgi:nucleoid-associated protein YgaU
MSSIAKKYLGSENAWRTIAKANPTVDPTAMKIGTKLRIPAADQADATPASRAAAPAAASSAGGAETTHLVASGDTLASIARKYYGNTKHWERIYSDPAALKIGQKLRIPAKSSVVTGEASSR